MNERSPHALPPFILQLGGLARPLLLDLIEALLFGEQSRGKDDREAVGREFVPRRGIGF